MGFTYRLVVALAIISVTCFRFLVSSSGERKDVPLVAPLKLKFILYGAFVGALGPTLRDLKHLFQASMLQISNLFLILATAEGVGSLGSMVILKFLDSNLVFIVCVFLQGTSVVLFEMTPHFYVACVTIGVIGIVSACGVNCVIYQSGIVFPGISAILHGVFISYSVGGIIEPFLAFQDRTPLATNQTTNNSPSSQDCKSFRDPLSITNIQSNAKSEMQDLYITLGSLHLPAFLGFIILFLLERRDTMQHQRNASINGDYIIMEEGPEPISRPSAILFYTCLVFANISYSGLQYAYGGYLSVYGVTSHLHLSAQRMADMTSAYWMFFALGRILGTILSLHMRQTVLIYTCLISVLMESASVIVLTPFGEVWLWIGTMAIGLFSGPLLAGGLVWCGSWLTLSPVVVGLCTFGDLTGTFLLQYCTGKLMGHFGGNWYLKFMLILSVIELMTFAILTVIRYTIEKSRVCRK